MVPTEAAAAYGLSGTRYTGESALRFEAYRWASTSMSGSTRSAGTKTSSATVVTLPEPHTPAVNQSSTICRSAIGTRAMTGCIPPSGVGARVMISCQWLCRAPLMKFHCPLTT
jgi:hypothetical protein